MKRRKADHQDNHPEPFNNPFRTLQQKLGPLPEAPAQLAPPRSSSRTAAPLPSKAVLRLERAGRGGKEVTCLELRDLREPELVRWLKELKQLLGCGGCLEDGTLVLQGDQRERLKTLLVQRGIRSLSVG